jgi:hypothetical protein
MLGIDVSFWHVDLGGAVELAALIFTIYRFHLSNIRRIDKFHMANLRRIDEGISQIREIKSKMDLMFHWFQKTVIERDKQ